MLQDKADKDSNELPDLDLAPKEQEPEEEKV
jgi:hypothetical protein